MLFGFGNMNNMNVNNISGFGHRHCSVCGGKINNFNPLFNFNNNNYSDINGANFNRYQANIVRMRMARAKYCQGMQGAQIPRFYGRFNGFSNSFQYPAYAAQSRQFTCMNRVAPKPMFYKIFSFLLNLISAFTGNNKANTQQANNTPVITNTEIIETPDNNASDEIKNDLPIEPINTPPIDYNTNTNKVSTVSFTSLTDNKSNGFKFDPSLLDSISAEPPELDDNNSLNVAPPDAQDVPLPEPKFDLLEPLDPEPVKFTPIDLNSYNNTVSNVSFTLPSNSSGNKIDLSNLDFSLEPTLPDIQDIDVKDDNQPVDVKAPDAQDVPLPEPKFDLSEPLNPEPVKFTPIDLNSYNNTVSNVSFTLPSNFTINNNFNSQNNFKLDPAALDALLKLDDVKDTNTPNDVNNTAKQDSTPETVQTPEPKPAPKKWYNFFSW